MGDSGLQECKARHETAQAEAAAAQAAAQQQSGALARELAARPSQAEMAALRERVEALRLLVDSREEDSEPEQAEGAAPCLTSASQGNQGCRHGTARGSVRDVSIQLSTCTARMNSQCLQHDAGSGEAAASSASQLHAALQVRQGQCSLEFFL